MSYAVTYQGKLLDAGLPNDPSYIKKLREQATGDGLRGYNLFHKSNPISYLLLSAVDDILTYNYLGYDPEYSK